MLKATTIKEAIAKFEEKHNVKASEAEEVKLIAQIPPIEKMDASLSTLVRCRKLSLSTNCIEKIANLNGLKCLTILSLARNNIKSLTGLLYQSIQLRKINHGKEAVSETLEQLWMSYNLLEKLKGVNVLKKLKVFYFANDQVKDVQELDKLKDLTCLEEINVTGNPFADGLGEDLHETVTKKLPNLKKLDGVPVVRAEQEQEQQEEV